MSFRVFIHGEENSRTLAHLFEKTGDSEWTITYPGVEQNGICTIASTLDVAVAQFLSHRYGIDQAEFHITQLGENYSTTCDGDYDCAVRSGRLPRSWQEPYCSRGAVTSSSSETTWWSIPNSTLDRFTAATRDAAVRLGEMCDSSSIQSTFPRRKYLTMMPYSSYEKTSRCLTMKDLKRMRVVSLRVFYAIKNSTIFTKTSYERSVHLWREHFQSLIRYGIMIGKEIKLRGGTDSSIAVFQALYIRGTFSKPTWVYWPRLQRSHRAYLKLREYRSQAAKYIHEHCLDSQHPSLHQYLRARNMLDIRNLDCSNIFNILSSSELGVGHYGEIFNGVEAGESFVFPARL